MSLKDLQQKYWSTFIKVALIKIKLSSGKYRLVKTVGIDVAISKDYYLYISIDKDCDEYEDEHENKYGSEAEELDSWFEYAYEKYDD